MMPDPTNPPAARRMKAFLTQLHYCVPLTKKQWDSLNRINARGDDREDIDPALKKAGAENVEFNGHFGRNIFFSIEKERHLGACFGNHRKANL